MTREAMTVTPGTATFIGRYGLVRYTRDLAARYPREGKCELALCRMWQAANLGDAMEGKEKAERRLAALREESARLAGRHARLLSWHPRTDQTRRKRRCELDAVRRRRREADAEAGDIVTRTLPMWQDFVAQCQAPSGPLVFDHCHLHGWVRGLICTPCNNALGPVEHGYGAARPRCWRDMVEEYLALCPDCRREAPASRPGR